MWYAESADKVVLVVRPKGLQKSTNNPDRPDAQDINGPHGIAVSPDKK